MQPIFLWLLQAGAVERISQVKFTYSQFAFPGGDNGLVEREYAFRAVTVCLIKEICDKQSHAHKRCAQKPNGMGWDIVLCFPCPSQVRIGHHFNTGLLWTQAMWLHVPALGTRQAQGIGLSGVCKEAASCNFEGWPLSYQLPSPFPSSPSITNWAGGCERPG